MWEPSFPELESLLTLMETSVSCAVKCYRSSKLKGTVHDTTLRKYITAGKVREWLSFLHKIHKKQWLLQLATKLGQGNIFRSVCQEFCPQAGGGCMAGGHAWQGGVSGRGACVADTTRYGQWADGTHPTGMHSCFISDSLFKAGSHELKWRPWDIT